MTTINLAQKEIEMVRSSAFFVNVMDSNKERLIGELLSKTNSKKHESLIEYFNYLTSNEGVKRYSVDFLCFGAGHLTFESTSEEAIDKTIHQLMNGAFGKYAKRDDIYIRKVSPAVTGDNNSYKDFLKYKETLLQENYA